MLHSVCQQIWKTQQWPQDWKMSVFIPIPKKGNAKECANYCLHPPGDRASPQAERDGSGLLLRGVGGDSPLPF